MTGQVVPNVSPGLFLVATFKEMFSVSPVSSVFYHALSFAIDELVSSWKGRGERI